jgi:membrane fusion protein, multidrug efflux system
VRAVIVALVLLGGFALAQETTLVPAAGDLKWYKPRPVTSNAHESLTGQFFPAKLLPLGFEAGGRLMKLRAAKGDVVKEGQLLAQLDPEIIDAQVAQAEAGLAAAEAGAELATDVAGRNEKLRAEGSISDVQNKNATMTSKQAQANVAMAKAALAQARAGRKRHDLHTPIGGTVIDAPDNIGGMIGPGLPVFIIQQIDTLIFKTTISESTRPFVKPGMKVHVESVASGAATDDATVKVVIASADPNTRRIPVEIIVPNADGRFVTQTLARATLPISESKKAIAIPTSALGTTGGEHVVTRGSNGALKKVAVTVLERNSKEVVVVPSEPVDQVVDTPAAALERGKGPT